MGINASAISTEVIITTYNNPKALHLTLLALWGQSVTAFSVCIADDGSGAETQAVVKHWQQKWQDKLRHVWQPDAGFQKNKILNQAIKTSSADYLVFLDGDCIACPHYIQRHFELRKKNRFVSGSLIRMPLMDNNYLNDSWVTSGEIFSLVWLRQHGCIKRLGNWLKAATLPLWVLNFLEQISPVKKVWNGCNAAGWRSDILRVNGFDETMRYGSEDVELGVRLTNSGVNGRHIRYTAPVLHIEHSRSYADPAIKAKNKAYMKSVRKSGKTWTDHGIVQKQNAPLLSPSTAP